MAENLQTYLTNFQIKRGKASDWEDEVLKPGELGYDIDNNILKIGGPAETNEKNGETIYTSWKELQPVNSFEGIVIKQSELVQNPEGYDPGNYLVLTLENGTKQYTKISNGDLVGKKIIENKKVLGEVFNDYTKNKVSGLHAHAEGTETSASGIGAHSEGYLSAALNDEAHAEGYFTNAKGQASHAEGLSTKATGESSHSEGRGTEATGKRAHAEGSYTKATGTSSHAEGATTMATGTGSHSEGYMTNALQSGAHAEGYQTEASGYGAHTEGYAQGNNKVQAFAAGAHAEGYETHASGIAAHAEGYKTQASGNYSHAEGSNTKAGHTNSHASGYFTETATQNQFVTGTANQKNTSAIFIVGNGTITESSQEIKRSNAFEVLSDGSATIKKTNINNPNSVVNTQYLEKKYLIIGDSYTVGKELGDNELTWAEHFVKHLNLELGKNCFISAQRGAGFGWDENQELSFTRTLIRSYQEDNNDKDDEFIRSSLLSETQKQEITDIILEIGGNDIAHISENMEAFTTTNGVVVKGIDQFMQCVKENFPKAKVTAFYAGWRFGYEYRKDLQALYNSLNKLLPQHGIKCYSKIFQVLHNKNALGQGTDGVHPNAFGHQKLSFAIANAIQGSPDLLDETTYHNIQIGDTIIGQAYRNDGNIIIHLGNNIINLNTTLNIDNETVEVGKLSCDILFGNNGNLMSWFYNTVVINAQAGNSQIATLLFCICKNSEGKLALMARSFDKNYESIKEINFYNNTIIIPIWDA